MEGVERMSIWSNQIMEYAEEYRKFMKDIKEPEKIPPHKYGLIVAGKRKKKKKGRWKE